MSSWFKAGSQCTINGSVVSKDSGNSWQCAYGIQEVSAGKHEWKIKYISGNPYVMIGIASNTKWTEDYCWQRNDTYCYLYYGNNGYKHSQSGGEQYSESYKAGDVITVLLDLENRTIKFGKNGVILGAAYSNIEPQQAYRLTVSLCSHGDKMEMISYNKVSEEEKEEMKEVNINYIEECIDLITKQCECLKDKYAKEKMEAFNVKQLNDTSRYLSTLSSNTARLTEQFTKYETELLRTQNTLRECTAISTANYAKWSMKEIEIWLYSLENGRYEKYVANLLKGFKEDEISGADLPELDQGDLKSFGLSIFKDRKDLKKLLQALKQENEGMVMDTSY